MPKPRKVRNTRQVELLDTVYWCGLIKSQSGLSDAQIEKQLDLGVDPSGRKFNRWLNGVRAMSHDQIQIVVRRAREVGLLGSRKNLCTHFDSAAERRASVNSSHRASTELLETMKAISELHKARRILNEAVLNFQNAAVAASRHGVEIFDTLKDSPNSDPDQLLEACDIGLISVQVREIASWYAFEGTAHGLA